MKSNILIIQLIIMTNYQIMQENEKQNAQRKAKQDIKLVKLFRNSSQYRLGSFVFRPGITVEDIKGKLANVSPAYRYCKKQMLTVRVWLKFCTQWNHGILQLGSHGFSTFFNDFKTINMKILLVLNLEKNNISSIELIQHLDAPNLDCIYLHGNPIVSIKSFRKARFPKLTRLYINGLDNEFLSQFQCQNLSLIQNAPRTVQKFQWKKNNTVRWIAKIESQKLRRVLTGLNKYAETLDKEAFKVLESKNKTLHIS